MRRSMAAIICLTAVSVACASWHRAQGAPATPLPELIADTTGPYRLRVDRRVDPARQFALLAAERYAPASDSVRAAAVRAGYPFNKSPVAEGQWWYEDFDGTRIPFALTDDAVRYYIARLNDLARRDGKSGGLPMTSAGFYYSATVTPADSIAAEAARPRDGYVVDLTMRWSQWCGDLCSLVLGKTRRVWVASDGRVLVVEGDGLTSYVVSESMPKPTTWSVARLSKR